MTNKIDAVLSLARLQEISRRRIIAMKCHLHPSYGFDSSGIRLAGIPTPINAIIYSLGGGFLLHSERRQQNALAATLARLYRFDDDILCRTAYGRLLARSHPLTAVIQFSLFRDYVCFNLISVSDAFRM